MTQQQPFEHGPFLAAAVLCERVLVEKDGVNSLIRMVDRVIRHPIVQTPTDTLEPFEQRLSLYISFKSGSARGGRNLSVRIQKPLGDSIQPLVTPINFEGEDDRGVNLITELQMQIDQAGLWWFDVRLDDVPVTRLPLRVVYLPQPMPGPMPGAQPQ